MAGKENPTEFVSAGHLVLTSCLTRLTDSCGSYFNSVIRYVEPEGAGMKTDSSLSYIVVNGIPVLSDLEQASKLMSQATGFNHAVVVAYILAGLKPYLAPAIITERTRSKNLPTGGAISRTTASTQIK